MGRPAEEGEGAVEANSTEMIDTTGGSFYCGDTRLEFFTCFPLVEKLYQYQHPPVPAFPSSSCTSCTSILSANFNWERVCMKNTQRTDRKLIPGTLLILIALIAAAGFSGIGVEAAVPRASNPALITTEATQPSMVNECPFCRNLSGPYRHRFINDATSTDIARECGGELSGECHFNSDRSGSCQDNHPRCGSDEPDNDDVEIAIRAGDGEALRQLLKRERVRLTFSGGELTIETTDCSGALAGHFPVRDLMVARVLAGD